MALLVQLLGFILDIKSGNILTSNNRSFWDKLWRDKDGHLSLIELPNIPLAFAALFWIISIVMPAGKFKSGAEILNFGFLFTWAWLEIKTGKSYFRRILGCVILLYIVVSRVR